MTSVSRRLLPSTQSLAAFDAVARHESFSDAASELSLTQGAVSRQIAALEIQLNITLFERNSRQVALTNAGRNYLQVIRPALAAIRDASLNIMSHMGSNTLNLALLPTFGTRWLIPKIPRFVAQYPDIILNFSTRIGKVDFEKEKLDAAIHIGQPDWQDADFTYLMDETVLPVCSPAFLQNHQVNMPSDLIKMPLFHLASRPNAWAHWFKTLGIEQPLHSSMRFEQFSNVSQACIAGLGIALMPEFLIHTEIAAGQLVPVWPHKIKSQSNYYFVTPKTHQPQPTVQAFKNWLLSEISQDTSAT
ncbi:transcriptional regulator GcvA [Brucellaceae bacterium C25G]